MTESSGSGVSWGTGSCRIVERSGPGERRLGFIRGWGEVEFLSRLTPGEGDRRVELVFTKSSIFGRSGLLCSILVRSIFVGREYSIRVCSSARRKVFFGFNSPFFNRGALGFGGGAVSCRSFAEELDLRR